MTAYETISLVRMCLDDSQDWYFPDIIKAISEAQIQITRKYYALQDESCIAPLYRKDWFLGYNDTISARDTNNVKIGPANVMYPRAVRVYNKDTDAQYKSVTATYMDYYKFINMNYPSYEAYNTVANAPLYPKTAVYTLSKAQEQLDPLPFILTPVTKLLWNATPLFSKADIWYIKEPTFNYDEANANLDGALELPPEYHPEVCFMAAEMLNDIDVAEMERGEVAFQNQKLNANMTGGDNA